jgi:signal transduction histidine kinase
VENLLDFSRYQSERMVLVLRPVQIDRLLEEVIFSLQKKMEKKELHLIVETTPAEIMADSDKFKQVMLNILDNAIKFSNKGEDNKCSFKCLLFRGIFPDLSQL